MKKSSIRLISLLLALAMSVSLLSANVWATEVDGDSSDVSTMSTVEAQEGAGEENEDPQESESEEEKEYGKKSDSEENGKDEEGEKEVAESEAKEEKEEEEDEKSEAEEEEKEPKDEPQEEEAPEEAKEEVKSKEADVIESDAEKSDFSQDEEEATISTQSSGTHGDSITWTYDEDTHSFTVSGTGKVEKIGGEYPWSDITGIKRITFESGITSIGANAFDSGDGYDLEEVNIGDTVESIGGSAFSGCRNLKRITIPSSVKKIGAYAFSYCERMTTLSLTDGLTSIGSGAFSGCSGLTSVSIPDSVTTIGEGAFRDCSYLYEVKLPSGLTEVSDDLFYGDYQLTRITLPDSVLSIGEYSFYECWNLSQINSPKALTEINEGAFNCTNISKVIIPSAVTYVADDAFNGISQIIFEGTPFSTWSNCISNSYNCSLYYPDRYKDRWSILSYYDNEWKPYCHLQNDKIITAHTFSKGVVTKEPTYTQSGIKTYTCAYCGCEKSEIIPVLVKDPTPLTKCTVKLSQLKYTYDGKAKKPGVSVVYNGTKVQNSNYTLSYSSNVNAGTATVKITGKNDLSGMATKTFKIEKSEQSMSIKLTENEIYPGKTSNAICNGIGTLQYSSSNTRIATVNSRGKITGVAKGTASISVLASRDSNHKSALKSITITVLKPKPTQKECEKLYAPVLDMFYYNTKTGWKNYPDISTGLSSVSYLYPMYMTSKSECKLFAYCFKDINSDGTPELIISSSGAKNQTIIDDLYTCVNGQLYHLLSSGERYHHYLLSDGTLLEEASGGASTEYYNHYQLKKNAKSFTYLEGLVSNYGKYYRVTKAKWDKYGGWMESSSDSISKKKLNSILNAWPKTIKYNATLFSKYSPRSKSAVYVAVSGSVPETTLKSAKPGKAGCINATWEKNSKGKGYWVQCSTDKKFLKNVKTTRIKGAGKTKTIVKGLKKGTWYIRICTVKGSSYSSWSGSKKVKVK